jgi:hypothetical protein
MNLTCRCKRKEQTKLTRSSRKTRNTHGEGEMEREGGDGRRRLMEGKMMKLFLLGGWWRHSNFFLGPLFTHHTIKM